MKRISIYGTEYWLVTAMPDYDQAVELTWEIDGVVSTGLTARESARPLHERLRVDDFSYATWLHGLNAREIEQALRERRTEKLLVPLWPLARPSAEYADGEWRAEIYMCYEVVDGEAEVLATWTGRDVLTDAAVTATSFTVPCIAGDFKDGKWPTFVALDDELVDVEFSFEENAPAAMAAEVVGMSYSVGPENAPAAGAVRDVFPLLVDWGTSPEVRHEYALERRWIGQSRVTSMADHGSVPVREYECGCQCMDGDEIAMLVGFFQKCSGVAKRFWLPGTLAQCVLLEDVIAATQTLAVGGADDLGLGRYVAFVDGDGERVQISQLALGSGAGVLELVHEVNGLTAARTSVMEAVYVRFAKTKLRLRFTSDLSAEASVTFRECPWETSGTEDEAMGQRERRVSLYELRDPATNDGWPLTSHESVVIMNGGTYFPYPITHGAMKQTVTMEDECEVEAQLLSANAPFQKYFTLEIPRLMVKVIRATIINGEVVNVVRTFVGEAHGAKVKGNVMKFTVKSFRREVDGFYPRVRFQRLCGYGLFSEGCGVAKSAWRLLGTITSISADGRDLGIDLLAIGTIPEDFFAWGYLQKGVRKTMILSSSLRVGLAMTMRVIPLPGLEVGDPVTCVPECDGRAATCKVFGNFHNFGGNMVANGNLSLIKVGGDQTGGSKK